MIKLFEDYEKKHPEAVSPFDLAEAFGLTEVEKMVKESNGRKIVVIDPKEKEILDGQTLAYSN